MKALTLTQPWATLSLAPLLIELRRDGFVIPQGQPPMLHETRDWKLRQGHLPMRLAIHAGKGDAKLRDSLIENDRFIERYARPLHYCGYSTVDPWARNRSHVPDLLNAGRTEPVKELPLGAIIGLVTFTYVRETGGLGGIEPLHALDESLGNWSPGRYAFRMEDPVMLDRPVPCRGAQMLWTVPAAVQAEVTALLAGAR